MPKIYGGADVVEEIANRLIPTYHSEIASARIQYIFEDTASMKNGKPVLGKVRKVTGAMEYLLDKDFIMMVAMDCWQQMDESHRVALVDHLLERCSGEEDEKTGDMKWILREPDVQEFTTILRRHGAWTVDLEGLVSVAQEIQIEERVQEVEDEIQQQSESDDDDFDGVI